MDHLYHIWGGHSILKPKCQMEFVKLKELIWPVKRLYVTLNAAIGPMVRLQLDQARRSAGFRPGCSAIGYALADSCIESDSMRSARM